MQSCMKNMVHVKGSTSNEDIQVISSIYAQNHQSVIIKWYSSKMHGVIEMKMRMTLLKMLYELRMWHQLIPIYDMIWIKPPWT